VTHYPCVTGAPRRRGGEEGQTLTEYALLLLLIALVVIAAVTAFGGQVTVWFNAVTAAF
jgi:Flp pilus assembly pilin Flp